LLAFLHRAPSVRLELTNNSDAVLSGVNEFDLRKTVAVTPRRDPTRQLNDRVTAQLNATAIVKFAPCDATSFATNSNPSKRSPAEIAIDLRDIDLALGERLRQARVMRNLTQQGLGRLLGVAAQQIHKYETATSSVSANRLWAIALALNIPPNALLPPSPGIPAQPTEDARLAALCKLTPAAVSLLLQTIRSWTKDETDDLD
jgi:transcriptional regulator with XRE-family HTH domain